eukprot:TRINITY_DN1956_c0_g1_i2.p1 TRINITY_DN1956_c0_g1~~TRINITY_DN1956_c0_g1_i2.p1  ORF type:complete len:181 (+),score=44.82 TRINITY_DN1956_c0_g1_i2:58-600(+)
MLRRFWGRREAAAARKGVTYDEDGCITSCVFCSIAQGGPESEEAVYRGDGVAVFPSQAKDAPLHLLVVPDRHVRSLPDLMAEPPEEAYDLLVRMSAAADAAVDLYSAVEKPVVTKVFHKPPFTSVDHLHLHVLAGPWRTFQKQWKHTPGWMSWKPWTVGLDTVLDSVRSKIRHTQAQAAL